MAKEQLGFIGVGRMGGPMAGRLLDAGYPLIICDKDERAMAPLLARRAQRAASPAALASVVETILVSLPTPAVVQTVALGDDGVIAGSKVRTFIDLSTS